MPSEPLVELSSVDLSKRVYSRAEVYSTHLPHRYDFELLDAIHVLDPGSKLIVGSHQVRGDEFWVRGHVPGMPLFPGVLMVEAAAQLCAVLYKAVVPEVRGKFIAFGGIDNVRFRGAVRPGDSIVFVGRGTESSPRACRCAAQAFVQTRMVFEGVILGIPLRS
jgi:3-hydroxyacyl-[acyl-carrier-protein] dehydratase